MRLRLLLALAGLGAVVGAAAAPHPLSLLDAVLTSSNGLTIVSAPGWALLGVARGVTPAGSLSGCAAACAGSQACQWANFCSEKVREGRKHHGQSFSKGRDRDAGGAASAPLMPSLPLLPTQEGCTDGNAGRLAFQQCQLLGGNGTVWPAGRRGEGISTTAGARPRRSKLQQHS